MQKYIDQAIHVVAGFGLVLLASGGVFGGLVAGLGIGLVRELSEAGDSRITYEEVKAHFTKGRDPWIDLAFWALGGAVAGVLV